MNAELVLFVIVMSFAGTLLGTFTGLVPGIHVNTLASLLLISYPVLDSSLSSFFPCEYVPILVASCIISAAVVHSFVDFVPSVFLGAPDPDEVMNILPGHRMLMNGNGMEAIRSAAAGSAVGTAAAVIAAIPMHFLFSSPFGEYMESITLIVLVSAVIMLAVNERGAGVAWSLTLIALSGILGSVCMFGVPSINRGSEGNMLFPLLTGLFGMPALILSMNGGKVPEQTDLIPADDNCVPGLKGTLVGGIVGWFPGITATVGAVIGGTVLPEKDPKHFISLVASIGSASTVFALVTLSVSGHGRTGTMLVVRGIVGSAEAWNGTFLFLLLSVAVACLLGYRITIWSGRFVSKAISGRDMRSVNIAAIAMIVILAMVMTGPYGMLVLASSTAIGLIPTAADAGRVHLAGCLIIPAILLQTGLSEIFVNIF